MTGMVFVCSPSLQHTVVLCDHYVRRISSVITMILINN